MKKSLLSMIVDFILGNKYYCNLVNVKGTSEIEMSSYIFRTKERALLHKQRIQSTRTYQHVETVSFRSRKIYQDNMPD